MPAFSQGLEKALHQALTFANERHHEYATLEHLLMALTDDEDAVAVLKACAVEIDRDDLDARKNEEQEVKGSGSTHNKKQDKSDAHDSR